jgi:hypothetical protein
LIMLHELREETQILFTKTKPKLYN